MLRGRAAGLRARQESDIAVLHAELYDDLATRMIADTRAWVPLPAGLSPYAVQQAAPDAAMFSVVELSGGDLAGEALLWGIDLHNRSAHLGLSLRPSKRGRGLGTDTLHLLCDYGFRVRGLHRLQVETAAGNTAMLACAQACRFAVEGTLQQAAWVGGAFADVVVMGRLAGTDGEPPPRDGRPTGAAC